MSFTRKILTTLLLTLFLTLFTGLPSSFAVNKIVLEKDEPAGQEYDRLRTAKVAPKPKMKKGDADDVHSYDPVQHASNVLSISDGFGTKTFANKSQAKKIFEIREQQAKKIQAQLKQSQSKAKKQAKKKDDDSSVTDDIKTKEVETKEVTSGYNIYATDIDVQSTDDDTASVSSATSKSSASTRSSVSLVKEDNTHPNAFSRFSQQMNFVVAGRVLCHCIKGKPEMNCGGLALGCKDGLQQGLQFFTNVIKALDPSDKRAVAIFDGEHRHPLITKEVRKGFSDKVLLPEDQWNKELMVFEKTAEENIFAIAEILEEQFEHLEFDMIYYNYTLPESDASAIAGNDPVRVFQGLRVRSRPVVEDVVSDVVQGAAKTTPPGNI